MSIADELQAFLAEARDLPFAVGSADCVYWPARWIERIHGRPMVLPSVKTRAEADALIARYGSLVAVVEEAVTAYGLKPVEKWPTVGDVGIVQTPRGPAGGIFGKFGDFYWKATVGFETLKPLPRRILRAWSIAPSA